MRPRVPLGFHLMLTDHSFSQVYVAGKLSLTMCVYTYDFLCVIDCGFFFFVQGKTGGVGWYIGWKRQTLRKFAGYWRFLSRSAITRFFSLQRT